MPQNCLIVSPGMIDSSDLTADVTVGQAVCNATSVNSISIPFGCCPLRPGVYNALPRSWCHQWRKYIKTGDGDKPLHPDASVLLCDAHKLPLVPPHLESYLYGETSALLLCSGVNISNGTGEELVQRPTSHGSVRSDGMVSPFASVPVGYNPVEINQCDDGTINALRAAGLSENEVQSQRMAMLHLEQRRSDEAQESAVAQQTNNLLSSPELAHESMNEQLDRNNYLVVEILTDEDFSALGKWWPEFHSSYALRFAITENSASRLGADILWSTPPCRECDTSGKPCKEFVGRTQRARRIRRHGKVTNGKGR